MRIRNSAVFAGIAGIALVLSACGGNESTETSTSEAAPASPTAAESSENAAPAGNTAADLGIAAAGDPIELKPLTIGYVNYVAANLEAMRMELATKAAAEALGWTFIPCDGQGVPATMSKCATGLVNQDVDYLLTNGFPEAIFTEALGIAATKGIPVISVGGDPGPKEALSAAYYPSDADMGTALADWMINKLGADSNATIIQQNFPAEFIVARNLAMEAAIAKTTITIAGMFDADPANLIAGTKDATTAQLNALPDAKALWIPFSSSDAGASQALEAKYLGKSFPERPLLLGVYASLPTLELIRQGKVDASVENALEWISWVALDQVAQNAMRGTALSQDSDPFYGVDLNWGTPIVVDSTNLPPEGELMPALADFVSYFTSKWGAEFTNLG